MQHQTQRFDARVFAPGFHTGSRIRAQWQALAGETASFYWRADIAPRARNWVRALTASATALATPARS
jgi:hypothetical protein